MSGIPGMKELNGIYEIKHEGYTITGTPRDGHYIISTVPRAGYGNGFATVDDVTDGMRRALETLKADIAMQRAQKP